MFSAADLRSGFTRLLSQPLPGRPAQQAFEPEVALGRHFGPPPANARSAGVAVVLHPVNRRWHILLTLRPVNMSAHAGQISFPGGMTDYEETPRQAAPRELHEELDVEPNQLTWIGRLSPLYVFASNCVVEPWLAIADETLMCRRNPAEVDEVIHFSADALVDPEVRGVCVIRRRSLAFTAPCLIWERHHIWGATAMMLGELAASYAALI